MADIDEIIGNFSVLDDWDDRYRYLIELGRDLAPLPEAARTDAIVKVSEQIIDNAQVSLRAAELVAR